MGIWTSLEVLVRRWRLSLSALIVSIGLAVSVLAVQPPSYESRSVLLLTAPVPGPILANEATSGPRVLTNPILNFGTGLNNFSSVIIQAMRAPEAQGRLAAEGVDLRGVAITNGSNNPELLQVGPLVVVTATGTDPDVVLRSAAKATTATIATADRLQDELDVVDEFRVRVSQIASPETVTVGRGDAVRASVAVVVLGLLASLSLVYAVEARNRRRDDF